MEGTYRIYVPAMKKGERKINKMHKQT